MAGKKLSALADLTRARINALVSGLASVRLYAVDAEEAADADKGKGLDVSLLWEILARENVEVDSGTGARGLLEEDGGKTIRCTNAGGRAFTVPDGLPDGWSCLIEAADGAGSVTIAGDGTTVMEGEKGSYTGTSFTLATRGKASIGVRGGAPTTSRVDGAVS